MLQRNMGRCGGAGPLSKVKHLIIASILLIAVGKVFSVTTVHQLVVRQPRFTDVLNFGSDGVLYELVDLQPRTQYEVRVSYPATIPSLIYFSWESDDEASAIRELQRRRLLNLEKVMFTTDLKAHPPGLLRVSADREGVHRDGPNAGNTLLYYNIELAPAIMGVPVVAFPVIMYILIGCVVIAYWVPYLHARGLPAILDWLAS